MRSYSSKIGFLFDQGYFDGHILQDGSETPCYSGSSRMGSVAMTELANGLLQSSSRIVVGHTDTGSLSSREKVHILSCVFDEATF